jgi:hypothetical protein
MAIFDGHADTDDAGLQRRGTARPVGRCGANLRVGGRHLLAPLPPSPSREGQLLMVETVILPQLP